MIQLRNQCKGLQIELDMEKNQMSAQEEMLHSLVHNISVEMHTLTAKTGGPAKPRRKKATEEQSFLDKRINQVYQMNN